MLRFLWYLVSVAGCYPARTQIERRHEMKTQRAFGQVVVLALLVAFGAAAGAATLLSASAQGDFIGAAEVNSEGIDVVIAYDQSGSMEFDTLCYGC
jgi:Mg-chelatase subunit ChlD